MFRARTTSLITLAALAAAPAAWAREYGTVISSTPIVAAVPVPQQECSERPVLVQPPVSGVAGLVGGIAGAAIGNNIGHGVGRAAATGLGFIAGSVIGSQAEANANPPVSTMSRECRTVNRTENRTIGYDVVYEYRGEQRRVQMAQDPGERIALDVQVSPVDAAPPQTYSQRPPVASPPVYAQPAYAPPVYAPPVYAQPAYAAPYYYPAPVAVNPWPAVSIGLGWGGYWGRPHGHWH